MEESSPNLGDIRRKSGISQDRLAKQTNIPLVTLQKRESGMRVPTIKGVQALAKILGDEVFHAEYGVPSSVSRGRKKNEEEPRFDT